VTPTRAQVTGSRLTPPVGSRSQALWRNRRRLLYRLYGEDEFLSGAPVESFESHQAELAGDSDIEVHDDWTPESGAAAQRFRRLAGTAMLLGAVGFAVGAILKDGSRPSRKDRRFDIPAASAYAFGATPQGVARHRSIEASGSAARRASSVRVRLVAPPAPRLFAHAHQWHTSWRPRAGRGAGRGQSSGVHQRSRVNANAPGARPVAGSQDTAPAAAEATDTESATVESQAVESPAREAPTAESRAAASASAPHPVTAGSVSSPPQMEFGFER
jgi:hypothetical protein